MTILRLVLALLVGVIVFATTVTGIEWIGHQTYPVPEAITELQAAIGTAMSEGRLDDAGRLGEELKGEMGIYAETREPTHFPPRIRQRMVAAGRLGRTTGQGFYTYSK